MYHSSQSSVCKRSRFKYLVHKYRQWYPSWAEELSPPYNESIINTRFRTWEVYELYFWHGDTELREDSTKPFPCQVHRSVKVWYAQSIMDWSWRDSRRYVYYFDFICPILLRRATRHIRQSTVSISLSLDKRLPQQWDNLVQTAMKISPFWG